MRLEKCWKCSPPTRLAACLSESLTSGVKGYARLCANPSFTGLDWHLRTRRIDNGSISRHSEARRHVRSGSQPAGSSSAAPGWPTMAKKKKRERRKAQKSVLQRRCGAFGAFLENLNSVSSTCAFGFFFLALLLTGAGVSTRSKGVFHVWDGAAVPQERACVRGLRDD